MGFGHLPQWKRHQIVNGRCLHCDLPFAGDGVVCTKDSVNQQGMVFLGDLPHAKPCQDG